MRLYLVGALAAFLMVGCGGGGSSNTNQSVATASLRGVAVDDLIVNGIVEAYAANDISNVLATGRTSATDGSYILDVTYDGVVVVKVTCDDDSLMKNPDDNTTKSCIDGMELRSATAVTPTSGTVEVEVNISPLSELMVRQMMVRQVSDENITAVAALEAAQNNIGLMFGLDPVAESPVLNDAYSDIISAIHNMANDDNKSILDIIDEINDDLKDGEAGDDGNISARLAEAMSDVNVSNNLTNGGGTYTPPPNSGSMSDIEQSKAFFDELRAQAMSVVDYNDNGTPGFLDNEAESLGTALENVALNADIAGEYVAGVITQILDTIDNNNTTSTKNIEGSKTRKSTVTRTTNTSTSVVWEYSVEDDGDEKYSGTVTFLQEIPSNFSPVNFETLTASYDGTVPMRELGNSTDTGEQRFVTNITLTKTTVGADFVLSNATLSAGADSMGISNFSISTGYDYNETEDKTTMNFVKLNSLTLNGTVSEYSMSGTVTVPTYVVNSEMIPKVVTFTGNITNTTTAASLTGTLSVDWLNAETMDLTEESNDEPSVDVSFNGRLQMPTHPVMVLNLGYTNPSQDNNLTFSYSYDATVINGTANFDEEMQNGTIVLTNHIGLEATIKQENGEIVYGAQSSVKKGGKVIGKLQQREDVPVIKYIDGTFESLP